MKHRSKNRYLFDFDAFLRAVILFGFILLLIWLIKTQQLTLYINPKFSGLVEIASYLLLPMLITQSLTIFRPAYTFDHDDHCHTARLMYIPFIAILRLAFVLPDNTLNANLVGTKGLNTQLSSPASAQDLPRPLAPKLRQLPLIEVTDRDYTEIMSELELFPQDYIGKEITMTGFVFKPPEAKANITSLVRYVIVCCTADAVPYGVLTELGEAGKYKDGTWLSIKGIIQQSTSEGRIGPVIKVTSWQQVKEPKNPYVFPPSQ